MPEADHPVRLSGFLLSHFRGACRQKRLPETPETLETIGIRDFARRAGVAETPETPETSRHR
jgi:hypothetical protein